MVNLGICFTIFLTFLINEAIVPIQGDEISSFTTISGTFSTLNETSSTTNETSSTINVTSSTMSETSPSIMSDTFSTTNETSSTTNETSSTINETSSTMSGTSPSIMTGTFSTTNGSSTTEIPMEGNGTELATSCKELLSWGYVTSGAYNLTIEGFNESEALIFCDLEILGGGWAVFQKRFDASETFNRSFEDFVGGFGNVSDGEFWMGLEKLHLITSGRPHELLVEVIDEGGSVLHVRYERFEVGDANTTYTVVELSEQCTPYPACTSFYTTKGREFVTYFGRRATVSVDCSIKYRGAWWHTECQRANLNGMYPIELYPLVKDKSQINYVSLIYWEGWPGFLGGMVKTRMAVRPIE